MPDIDILIPCYQYGRYLPECVGSVLSQGIKDLRVLIIDNASTDGSVEIARRLAAEDPRIEVRARRTNLGPTASFNEGIDWAASRYFMMLCADDLLAPGALARAIDFMNGHPNVAFALGQELEYREGDPAPSIDREKIRANWQVSSGHDFIRERCRIPASFLALGTMVVRTSVQKQAGHYKAHLTYTQDVDMMLRLASFGDVAETDAVQGIRRLHGSNLSDTYLRDRKSDLIYRKAAFDSFFEESGKSLSDAERLSKTVNWSIAVRAYRWGVRALCGGRIREAWDLLSYAASLSFLPTRLFSKPQDL